MSGKDIGSVISGVRKLTNLFSEGDITEEIKKNLNPSWEDEINPVNIYNGVTSDKVAGRPPTAIQEFYSGTNVLITGGTGFLGKLLIEKLLHSCPRINKIFMIVRNKKGKTVDVRTQELFQDQVFDRLRKDHPTFKEKIRIISGDCSLPGLGLSPEDRAGLMEHVHVVFNVAATVRFDEPLKFAIQTNIQGTRDLMLLCRDCQNIKAFVHVSTAYSHCYQTTINEEFYEVPITCDKAIQMAELLDEQMLNKITPLVLDKWPNTYTYTKAIAEDAVRTYGKTIPAGIFRPSIIVCTRKEPISGWLDNLYGPTGTVVGVGLGIIRTMNVDDKVVADLVPCDMVVSSLIASAWDVHSRKKSGEEDIPIYNYTSSHENPITWGGYIERNMKHSQDIAFLEAVWMMFFLPARILFLFKIYAFFLHTLPAYVVDGFLYTTGQKPKLLKTYEKIHKFFNILAYFSIREWKFTNENVQRLWQKLSSEDRSLFDFNIRNLHWDEFIRSSLMGIRTYILKQDPKTLPAALKRRYRLFWIHQAVKLALLCLFLKGLWILAKPLISAVSWDVVFSYYTKKIM